MVLIGSGDSLADAGGSTLAAMKPTLGGVDAELTREYKRRERRRD